MLRFYWDIGSALRTLDKFTYVHQPRDLPSTPWTEKIAGKKGWTCLCPLIAIRGHLSRRSAPMHPWPSLLSASPWNRCTERH